MTLTDLEKADLSKYINIKLTISEGKYKNRAFAYIPIETIRQLATNSCAEKTITLQLKGKPIGFTSIQCKIKAEFLNNNNILNS